MKSEREQIRAALAGLEVIWRELIPTVIGRDAIEFAHLQHKLFFGDVAAAYARTDPVNLILR